MLKEVNMPIVLFLLNSLKNFHETDKKKKKKKKKKKLHSSYKTLL